jgi:hypothetical protein
VLKSIVCDRDVPAATRHALLGVLIGLQGEARPDAAEWMAEILGGKP